ncbi:MAG: hypothetical protein OXG15_16575 [Gammaproteobacteria bacterium]|nr:hypothetical protein [Gammaproteobacteria bacterium]
MKKSLWYILGVLVVGALLYFVLGWLTSLLTIVALTIAVFVVFMFVRRRLNKQ